MKEERFTLEQWTEESLYFSDGEYSAHMSIGYICKKVEKKLNEQQDTIKDLNEENEQLKIANAKWFDKSLQDKQIRYSNANHKELTKKYLQLKEENKELRKELDNFKPVMFQDVRKGTVILYSKD